VEAMRADEARHRQTAVTLGAAELPAPAKAAMRALAKAMTTIAFRV
jgi:3-demethoxyubiquinol 3-hydroxylase